MKAITGSSTLPALIYAGNFVSWRIYTFMLANGGVIRLSTADFDIVDTLGNVFSCGSLGSGMPKIDSKDSKVQSSIKAGIGQVSTWQVYILPTIMDPFTGALTFPDVVGGTPWTVACAAGFFDGCAVEIQTAYFASVPTAPLSAAARTALGTTIDFVGVVGQIDLNETVTIFNINDYNRLINAPFPRYLYQSSCRNLLFDAKCGLLSSAFAQTGTVLAGSTAAAIKATPAAPGGSGSYQLGQITFTSGQNSGFSRLVTSWDGVSSFQLLYPLPYAPAVGDTFTVTPGCDKSLGASGCGGFSNTLNFNGEPYTPLPEIMLG